MARPREFDRDGALRKAMEVFWAKGFAATSTDDLLAAMEIGRQSLYNAFGDKWRLYVEALGQYQRDMVSGHLARLNKPASALAGIRDLLAGLFPDDAHIRSMGCMGVGSVGEFGNSEPELVKLRGAVAPVLHARLLERIRQGQEAGEIDPAMEPQQAAAFIQTTMAGLQIGARGGAGQADLKSMAEFAADRLRAR